MKQIIALQEYTDKYISLYEGEIRNIQNSIADKLIQQGVVAEHSEDQIAPSGGKNEMVIVIAELSSNEGNYIVNSVSHTYTEILEAENNGKLVIAKCVHTTNYGNQYYILPLFNAGTYNQALFRGYGNSSSTSARFTVSQNGTNSFEIQ